MNATLVTCDDDEISINLNDLEDFKSEYERHWLCSEVKCGDRIPFLSILWKSSYFENNQRLNTICSVLANKDIRGHAIIVNTEEFERWLKHDDNYSI